MLMGALIAIPAILATVPAEAAELSLRDEIVPVLVKHVPEILESYDSETGHFGRGIWLCTDQNPMYPLAVAYAYEAPGNKYYKDKELLEVTMKAGDALIDDADEMGRWEFRKKDGSTWGMTLMPWIYSRWIRAFALIKDDMPPDRCKHWTKALTLGYTSIIQQALNRIHNIPTHHAMGLYVAGKALDRPEWCEHASDFMMRVIDKQAEGGYWSENVGPVVSYNFVYIDALGTYYALSKDERVLPALEKSSTFHSYFVYPNGDRVETVDERNPYHAGIATGNVGFTFSPEGRSYLKQQWALYGMDRLPADLIASLLLYGEEGPVAEAPPSESEHLDVLTEGGEGKAAILQHGPWFVCLSAYTAPILESRWIQDRQNVVSIFHEKTGLILGGGNTKLQPAWSNFTVGDMDLLRHKAGEISPDFTPKGELYHVPSEATLVREPDVGLNLRYGPEECRVRVNPVSPVALEYQIEATISSDLPVIAHLTLIPHLKETLETGGGEKVTLDESPLELTSEQLGGTLTHAGYTLYLPENATLHWPALPHNPYRKDGSATAAEGRIEVRIPFDKQNSAYTIAIEIAE
ncbi:hypothetical protein ACFL6S_28240 [Candidatus Poribacteria bacterium]